MDDAVPEPSAPAPRFWLEGSVVAAASVLLAALVLQLWRQPFSYPFNYDGDGPYYLMLAQSLKEHGSYLVNPNLGFPYGQHLHDVPESLDFLHLVVLRLLAAVTSAPAATNVFQLLTFPTVAGVAHVVLRRFGIHRLLAGALALIYTIMPYHLQRRNSHLFLSSYAMVPVLVLLAMTLLSDRPPSLDPRRRQNWWTIAACVALAMTGPYYATFAVLLWAVAAGFAALDRRSWRPLVRVVAMVGVIGVVSLIEMIPHLRYWADNGRNSEVVARSPHETEVYGIRLQQLFMPRWDHRNGLLGELGIDSLRGPYLAEGTQSLGIIGGTAFLVVLGSVLLRLVRPVRVDAGTVPTVARLSLLAVASLLIGIGGGFGFFVSWAGLRPIRAYNRLVIVIAFCMLAIVGIVATRWLNAARRAKWVPIAIAGGLLALAFWDQASPNDATARSSGRITWEVDREFYATMGEGLPVGAGVLQLPYVSFPENTGVGAMGTYDPVRGFVHQPDLRWSFGLVQGRGDPPPPDLMTRTGADIVAYGRGIGARAIQLDRGGVADAGVAFEAALASVGVVPASESSDRRLVWFDLGTDDGG
jgi:phosphoglycerol transferase